MCNLFVSCGFAWNAANNPQFLIFFQKWLPGAIERVQHVEGQMKQLVKGKLATGYKTALIAMMMTVEYQTHTLHIHDVGAERKTANRLLKLVLEEIKYAQSELKVKIIGWCSDAGGDSRALRERLYRLKLWLVLIDCWGHQVHINTFKFNDS
ncbi:hypothetical protein K439DRAFT_1650071 [Ramaria rubella]|nr:hypothetical protein K439DRAFT_1650071 [Ramaria rubella]